MAVSQDTESGKKHEKAGDAVFTVGYIMFLALPILCIVFFVEGLPVVGAAMIACELGLLFAAIAVRKRNIRRIDEQKERYRKEHISEYDVYCGNYGTLRFEHDENSRWSKLISGAPHIFDQERDYSLTVDGARADAARLEKLFDRISACLGEMTEAIYAQRSKDIRSGTGHAPEASGFTVCHIYVPANREEPAELTVLLDDPAGELEMTLLIGEGSHKIEVITEGDV